MTGISCYWLESFFLHRRLSCRISSEPVAVNLKAAILEFCRYPPVTVASKFQSDLLNLFLISILTDRTISGYPPFVVAAATYLSAWQD